MYLMNSVWREKLTLSSFTKKAAIFVYLHFLARHCQQKMAAETDIIKDVLTEMGMGVFNNNFQKERVDAGMVESLSDTELARLGLQTMGDRFNFRKKIKDRLSRPDFSNLINNEIGGTENQVSTPVTRINVSQIRDRLFQPYNLRGRRRPGVASVSNRGRTWTANFVCLADTDASYVPSTQEKEILNRAGLGMKKITLNYEDDEDKVVSKLSSDKKGPDGKLEGFPKLKVAGGFELLRTSQNCRSLAVLNCNWSVKEMRGVVSAQTKLYIRPIQNNLCTLPENEESDKCLVIRKEKCQFCDEEFEIRSLRAHVEMCTPKAEAPTDVLETGETVTDISQQVHVSSNNQLISDFPQEMESEFDLNAIRTPPSLQNVPVSIQIEGQLQPNGNNIQLIVNRCVEYCHENGVNDPIEILRKLQLEIVTGRPLEVNCLSQELEGETNYITIDRENLLKTAFEELKDVSVEDLRNTLEVNFMGEV